MKSTKKKLEPANEGFKFEVGATYENMKGVYEVVSIHKDSMVIRWSDGSEIVTPLDLQRRIIERLAYEKNLRQQAEKTEEQEKTLKKPKRKK